MALERSLNDIKSELTRFIFQLWPSIILNQVLAYQANTILHLQFPKNTRESYACTRDLIFTGYLKCLQCQCCIPSTAAAPKSSTPPGSTTSPSSVASASTTPLDAAASARSHRTTAPCGSGWSGCPHSSVSVGSVGASATPRR